MDRVGNEEAMRKASMSAVMIGRRDRIIFKRFEHMGRMRHE